MRLLQTISAPSAEEQGACWGPHGRFRGNLYTSTPFAVSFEHTSLADFGMCRFRAKGAYRTTPTGSKHSGRHLAIILQLRGTVHYHCASLTATLTPRHWIIVDQAQPASTEGPSGADSLIMMIPRTKLVERSEILDSVLMRPISGERGMGKLVWQFVYSVFEELPRLEPHLEPGVVDTMTQLVRLAMSELSGEQALRSQKLALRERVKAYILDHLREPELDADRIAAELNCTKRYLHKLFEMEEASIGDYVRHLRLDRCRDEIMAPEFQEKSITQIAFSWGFNSSAHFSAAFKERFGTSPSLYRKAIG